MAYRQHFHTFYVGSARKLPGWLRRVLCSFSTAVYRIRLIGKSGLLTDLTSDSICWQLPETKVKVQPEVKEAYMRYEETLYYERKEAAEAATKATRIEDILALLEDCGDVPQELRDRLEKADADTLKRWHKLAAKVESVEEFAQKICESK